MDGIKNTIQQTQVNSATTSLNSSSNNHSTNATHSVTSQMQTAKQNTIAMQRNDLQTTDVLNIQGQNKSTTGPIESEKQVEELVQKLNETLTPLQPNIKFGVDQDNIFYVAAIDSKTNQVIRRFPAEEAQKALPKMQEVTGILFDSKG
jgi:flagellar protein FlaG